MKIKISMKAWVQAHNSEMQEWLKANAGEWVEVETDCLFTNQYNTEKYRIMDSMIVAVKDDARIGKAKCKYCGRITEADEPCTKHKQCASIPFNEDNTFFIKFPNGLLIKEMPRIKIGTYTFESTSFGYYWLYNCRKSIKFVYENRCFYTLNGIGYSRATAMLDVPYDVNVKLKKLLAQA